MLRRNTGPLSSLGVGAPTPPNVRIEQRDPTNYDFRSDYIADFWYNSLLRKLWILTSREPASVTKWQLIATGALTGGTVSFPCDIGTGVASNNTLKLLGGNSITTRSANDWEVYFDLAGDVVIPNSLRVSTLTGGLVTTDAQGNFSNVTGGSTPMTFFMVNQAGDSAYVAPTSDDGSVTFAWSTIIPGALSFTAAGGGGGGDVSKLKDDASDIALPSSGAIQLTGDTNITTAVVTHLGPQLQIKLNNSLSLPATTSDGTSGVIYIDGNRFISAKGVQNCFFGEEAGNLTISSSVCNVGIGSDCLKNLDTSDKNCALGVESLKALTGGSGEIIAIGYQAGLNLKTGSNCILIGPQSGSSLDDDESDNIFIGDTNGSSGMNGTTAIGYMGTTACHIMGIHNGSGLDADNGVVQVDQYGKLVKTKGTTGQVLTSTAGGVAWQTQVIPPTPGDPWTYHFINRGMTEIRYANGYWFTFGAQPGPSYEIYATATPLVSTSWVQIDKGDTTYVGDIYFAKDSWIILGTSNSFYHTTDVFSTWTKVTVPVSTGYSTISAKVYYDGTYFGISATKSLSPTEFYTATDLDGTWTKNNLYPAGYGASFLNGYWLVTTSAYKLYTATNPTGAFTLNAAVSNVTGPIYFGSDKWCYVYTTGGSMYITYTDDPTSTWTPYSFPFGVNYPSLKYVGNDYWSVIDQGKLYMADDPSGTWSEVDCNISNGTSSTTLVQDVTYSDDKYVAVGQFGYVTSADLVNGTWSLEDSGTTYQVDKVYANTTGLFGYKASRGMGFKQF